MSKFTCFLGGPNGPKIRGRRTKTDFKDRGCYPAVSCHQPVIPVFLKISNSSHNVNKFCNGSQVWTTGVTYLLSASTDKIRQRFTQKNDLFFTHHPVLGSQKRSLCFKSVLSGFKYLQITKKGHINALFSNAITMKHDNLLNKQHQISTTDLIPKLYYKYKFNTNTNNWSLFDLSAALCGLSATNLPVPSRSPARGQQVTFW